MKFGVVTDGSMDGTEQVSYTQRYQEIIREALAAEEAGFDFWGTSETHHFAPVTTISAPDALMGAVAMATKNLRLRYMAVPLPFYHPMFVAERLATMDVISGGRAELGTARGNNTVAFRTLEIDATKTRAMWQESLKVIALLLGGESVDFDGEFFHLKDVFIDPKVVQSPMPPLSSVATGLDSHEAAGRMGLGDMAWDGYFGWRYLEDCFRTYKQALQSAEPVGGVVNDTFCYFVSATACHEDAEVALEQVKPRAFGFVDLILRVYGPLADNQSYEYYRELETVKTYRRDLNVLMEHGPSVIAGNPDQITEVCKRLGSIGVDEMVFSIDGISHEAHLKTIELIGKHVIPAFASERTAEVPAAV
jgi:alkanesulfonate monooxygenase SsuD/methylene tetrahydromethanopterin reductase-like flavin-dependent oxidoreductase (luciferase family)